MGQASSTPQQDGRNLGGSPQGDNGGEGSRGSERAVPISHLRRSRRIRNSITQFGGRLMRSGSSPITHGSGSPTGSSNRVQSSRVRPRVGLSHPRSSPPLQLPGSSSPRNTGRSLSTPLPLPPTLSPELPSQLETDTDLIMSDPPDSVTPPYTPDEDSSLVNSPGLGSPRTAGSSRRNSQFRPGLYDGHDFDDDMEFGAPSSSNAPIEPTIRRAHPDFASFGDPSTMDLLENPRARPGEDQAAMLSRLLSVAAAMTAASLVGSSEQAFTEAQDVAGDSADGSFESFLRALQNGRLAAALRNGGNEMGGGVPAEPGSDGNLAPLNFFRMFRFGASTTNNHAPTESTETPPTRMIPVIIVGIRSVTPRESTNTMEPAPSPLMEQTANFSGRRNRTGHGNRRASMSAVGDNQRASGRASRPASEVLFPTAPSIPDTPQGPHPPPSTPADLGLSLINPGMINTAPNIASGSPEGTRMMGNSYGALSEGRHSTPPDAAEAGASPGGVRRDNATPSPGNSSQRRQGGEGTRSWIIYVLGGSYPESHPILTTPSLFTDSPTYEDMMLLSSLLGPAKPPVATPEDIETAGGLFTVSFGSPDVEGDRNGTRDRQCRKLSEGDRCLVCLSEYEAGEECRLLAQCRHVFHKECIDTVTSLPSAFIYHSQLTFYSGLPPGETHAPFAVAEALRRKNLFQPILSKFLNLFHVMIKFRTFN
ncbi:hypothetical protein L211DRAFT_178814 [Terfezia boudieri ATCC MYA-4762]|uniref:RING-type domain-containing protein n=1 Tax=Terfezia boudieri ATCC MYA-4762 TaxID=1051890 RepID=A0A3N4LP77_9PEZI|nr:hypothetical protein L211DRAFT_178814 [Terfezia boudieri ATCC MYA-4762]